MSASCGPRIDDTDRFALALTSGSAPVPADLRPFAGLALPEIEVLPRSVNADTGAGRESDAKRLGRFALVEDVDWGGW